MAVQDGIGSDDDQNGNSFYLAKCILRSSVVLHAVYGHIRSPLTFDLVFGKETALELVVLVEDGSVQSVCEQPVFGAIKDLKVLPWNESFRRPQPETHGKDILVLLSDSGKLSFLTFSVEMHRFLAISHVHLSHPGNSLRELGWLLAVEPRGCGIAVAAFEDKVAVFPTSQASGNNIVEKGILYPGDSVSSLVGQEPVRWGTVWSMAFVIAADEPGLVHPGGDLGLAVLLHRRGATGNELQILACNPKEHSMQLKARFNPSGSPLMLNVLDVPAVPGFLMLLRCSDIILLDVTTVVKLAAIIPLCNDEEKNFNVAASALLELHTRSDSPMDSDNSKVNTDVTTSEPDSADGRSQSITCNILPFVCSWCWEPDSAGQPRLILGLNTGELYIASFCLAPSGTLNVVVSECLYKCSPCRALVWAKGGFVAAMVEMGDGQVLKVGERTLCFQNFIQNNAPIIDFSLVDYYGEKQDQMFAACGVGPEGSLRVIRNGVSVERLFTTTPSYQGVTGTWTMRICCKDQFHAFLVISFVEETRVLSVGLNFVDITDASGFNASSSTLSCGLVHDGWIAQVCSHEVRICAPTKAAHPLGSLCATPIYRAWRPKEFCVSLGSVATGTIIVALSRPGMLVLLGTMMASDGSQELVELQHCFLQAEVSCISIPQEEELVPLPVPPTIVGLVETSEVNYFPFGVEIGKICMVGTHKPSVELLSIVPGENFRPLAVGLITLLTSIGNALTGCVPQDVRLVLSDRLYILTGLRNGMLIRFEWPKGYLTGPSELTNASASCEAKQVKMEDGKRLISSVNCSRGVWDYRMPVLLPMIAIRRIGVSPVWLIPLHSSLRADVIVLSDRPWLLQTARHGQRIAYTSISFQPSTHVTPVSSADCPTGILFVSDCSLHLVEMEHSKRLNVQKFPMNCTPRHVLYHSLAKSLLVMHTEASEEAYHPVSDISCVDPLSGAIHSCFRFDDGEVAKCMQLWKVGNEELLVVGTGLTFGRALMPSGEAESTKGRLLVFSLEPRHNKNITPTRTSSFSSNLEQSAVSLECLVSSDPMASGEHRVADGEGWELSFRSVMCLPGTVLSVRPYLGQYLLASAGNHLFCLSISSDNPLRLRRLAVTRTRFLIASVTVHFTRIAVADCRDGVLLYTYREDTHKLELLYCDPMQRLVADCLLVDQDTAVVMDRYGDFCVLSAANITEESTNPEKNLELSCWYHLGEISTSMHKGSFAYKFSFEDSVKSCTSCHIHGINDFSVVAGTLLGSVFLFVRLTRDDYELLEAVQTRLALYTITAPLLGNNHSQFRLRGCPRPGVKLVLDGDMLEQFLELTSEQQACIIKKQPDTLPTGTTCSKPAHAYQGNLPEERVLRLLERVHQFLNVLEWSPSNSCR